MPCLLMRSFKNQNTMLQWCRRLANSSKTPTGDEGVRDVCRPVCPSVHFLLLSFSSIGDMLRAAVVLAKSHWS